MVPLLKDELMVYIKMWFKIGLSDICWKYLILGILILKGEEYIKIERNNLLKLNLIKIIFIRNYIYSKLYLFPIFKIW